MTNPRPNNVTRWIGNVLLIAGAIAVGVSLVSWLSLTIWQSWQSRQFDQSRITAPPTTAQPRIANGSVVGRLAISRVHVRAMVREGDSDRTLSIALGHIPGTAFPGQQGNVGIAGHRDTLFRGLKNVAPGDEITFETPRASYVYRVKTTQIVTPEHTEVLKPGPDRELTLVTCFPFEYVGSAPDRFIVKARLVSEHVSDNDSAQKEIRDTPAPVAVAAHPSVPAAHNQIAFSLPEGHSRELVPGKIWVGLSTADVTDRSVNGWVWVMPDRRTVWLRDVGTRHPVIFYQDGEKVELVITGVERTSAKGYLIKSPARG